MASSSSRGEPFHVVNGRIVNEDQECRRNKIAGWNALMNAYEICPHCPGKRYFLGKEAIEEHSRQHFEQPEKNPLKTSTPNTTR